MKTLLRLPVAVLIAAVFGGSHAGAAKTRLDPAPPRSFSIVVIPDTQKYRGRGTKMEPSSTNEVTNATLESHCRWIAASREEQQIAFVTHVGDIVDRNVPEQWEVERRCMGCLDGRVPYGIAPGNHDMGGGGDAAEFVREFGPSRFAGSPWYGGAFAVASETQGPAGGASSFQLFSAGGFEFVILHLECNAPDTVLAWADGVFRAHAARRAIVTTHMDLGPIQKPKDEDDFFDGPKGRMAWAKVHGGLPDRDRIDVFTVESRDGSLCAGTKLVPDPGQHCFSIECALSGARAETGDSPERWRGAAVGRREMAEKGSGY